MSTKIISILLMAICTNMACATDFITFKQSSTSDVDINFSQSGKQKLALGILPTNDINPARGLRIGVRVDDGEMQTIDARQGYVDTFNEYTKENIARSKVLKPLPRPASDIYLSGSRQRMRSEISTTSDGSASISTYLQQAIIPLKL